MLPNSKRDAFRESDVTVSLPILKNVNAISWRHPGNWLRGLDLNQRPSGYEPDELPGCSTPRDNYGEMMRGIKLKADLKSASRTVQVSSGAVNSCQKKALQFFS